MHLFKKVGTLADSLWCFYDFACAKTSLSIRTYLQGGPTEVKATAILLVTFECIGKIQ